MSARLKTFIEALMMGQRGEAARCLSPCFGKHDGLTKQEFIEHEIEEFRQRLLPNERAPAIQVSQLSEANYEIRVVSEGLIYATDFTVDSEGFIRSNDNVVECVAKLRLQHTKIERALAVRSQDFLVQTITPRFPVTDCHLTLASEKGLFSYLYFSNETDPAQTFTGSLRVMMREASSANIKLDFPGLNKYADWQEKNFFPIIEGNRVKIPIGKSRPWGANAWFDDGSCVSIDRPEPGLDWKLDRAVAKAMVTDALDNDWVAEMKQ